MCIFTIWRSPSVPPRPPTAAARVYLSPLKVGGVYAEVEIMWLHLCPVGAACWWREVEIYALGFCHQICKINITRYQKPQIWPLTSDSLGKSNPKWGLKSLCLFAESLLTSDTPASLEWPLRGQSIYLSQLPALWTFPFWATKHSVPGGQNYKETVTHHQLPDWSGSHGASGSFSSKRWHVI